MNHPVVPKAVAPSGNGLWGIEWSRDLWRHVTWKVTSWPNTLKAQ